MNVLRYLFPIINTESTAALRARAQAEVAMQHPRNVLGGLCQSDFRSASTDSKSKHGAIPLASGPVACAPTPIAKVGMPAVLYDDLTDAIAPARCKSVRQAKDQLLRHLMAGRWEQAARMVKSDSPQYVVLHALGEIARAAAPAGRAGDDRKETRPREVLQFAVAPNYAPRLDGSRPEAEQTILSRIDDTHADGSKLAIALGSTYLWEPGQPLHCQDAVYTSRHATVVTDGLGGHGRADNLTVRQAREAAGTLLAHVVESARQTQPQPARFLADKAPALMALVDKTVNWTLKSSSDIQDQINKGVVVDDFGARAAALVVADCQDGLVAFGTGDCELLVGLADDKSQSGMAVQRFVAQENVSDPTMLGGFGQGTLERAQCRAVRFEPGHVSLFALGSDGVFGGRWRTGASGAFTRAAAAKGSTEAAVRDAVVESVRTQALVARTAALEAVAAKQRAGDLLAGLDDVALVVRRPLEPRKA